MPVAAWSQRFATGIEVIDEQHRRLFAAVNELGEAFQGGDAQVQIRKALDFLVDYTLEHFRTEEEFMQKHGFPGFAAHASEHARLVGEVQKLRASLEAGKPLTLQVTTFLADWLKHHIHEVDMAYVDFLRGRGVC